MSWTMSQCVSSILACLIQAREENSPKILVGTDHIPFGASVIAPGTSGLL